MKENKGNKEGHEDGNDNPEEGEGEDGEDPDERSIFIKNVDYKVEANELKDHFKECGEIKRVTILLDKLTN